MAEEVGVLEHALGQSARFGATELRGQDCRDFRRIESGESGVPTGDSPDKRSAVGYSRKQNEGIQGQTNVLVIPILAEILRSLVKRPE
jgi:hypothetical protein